MGSKRLLGWTLFSIALLIFFSACFAQPNDQKEYKPEKAIEFPHDVHAGQLKLDCQTCHKTGDSDGKVSRKICLDCHPSE